MDSDDGSRAPGGRESSQESGGEPLRVVLGSGSPRRQELLAHLRVPFEVVTPDIDESIGDGEDPAEYVARLSREKAEAVRAIVGRDAVVIAADTTVAVDHHVLAKPEDAADARRMLWLLSGRAHQVHTGLTVQAPGGVETSVTTTNVCFVELTEQLVDWYVATGEPFDKAGGYALQGAGGRLVASVEGSVSNVIGLPLHQLAELLGRLGIEC